MNKKELIEEYLSNLESFRHTLDDYREIFHPDFIQYEYPNLLNPNGNESDFNDIFIRLEKSQHMLDSQKYSVESYIENGDFVALEVHWSGKISNSIGQFKQGNIFEAKSAIILEFKDNKIHRQKNYDCFINLLNK